MTPEEYQRLKEAEKEHLRSLRKLKQAVSTLQRQKKLTDAVEKATVGPMDALNEHDALVRDLAIETAHNEARLDIALESVSQESVERAVQTAADEDAMRKAKAADLVRQLRSQVGSTSAEEETPSTPAAATSGSKTQEGQQAAKAPLPEKTIGRMKP